MLKRFSGKNYVRNDLLYIPEGYLAEKMAYICEKINFYCINRKCGKNAVRFDFRDF
jgi:hypothetical protein